MTKKTIDVLCEYEKLSYELSGPIDEVIKMLQDIRDRKQVKGSILILEYETEYGNYGDSDRQVVNLYERRLETDEEYAKRLFSEGAEKENQLAQKRKQLEQLKKELGEE